MGPAAYVKSRSAVILHLHWNSAGSAAQRQLPRQTRESRPPPQPVHWLPGGPHAVPCCLSRVRSHFLPPAHPALGTPPISGRPVAGEGREEAETKVAPGPIAFKALPAETSVPKLGCPHPHTLPSACHMSAHADQDLEPSLEPF